MPGSCVLSKSIFEDLLLYISVGWFHVLVTAQIYPSKPCACRMLVYGTCNPEGYGDENYEGLYLTDADIKDITPKMSGIPIKIEHRGLDVGRVVTAWMHEVSPFCCVLATIFRVFGSPRFFVSKHAKNISRQK